LWGVAGVLRMRNTGGCRPLGLADARPLQPRRQHSRLRLSLSQHHTPPFHGPIARTAPPHNASIPQSPATNHVSCEACVTAMREKNVLVLKRRERKKGMTSIVYCYIAVARKHKHETRTAHSHTDTPPQNPGTSVASQHTVTPHTQHTHITHHLAQQTAHVVDLCRPAG
jgi:hypothetical protein